MPNGHTSKLTDQIYIHFAYVCFIWHNITPYLKLQTSLYCCCVAEKKGRTSQKYFDIHGLPSNVFLQLVLIS